MGRSSGCFSTGPGTLDKAARTCCAGAVFRLLELTPVEMGAGRAPDRTTTLEFGDGVWTAVGEGD